MPRFAPPVLLALPSVVVAILVLLVLALTGLPVWLAALLAVAVGALVALVLWRTAPRTALRALGARPVGSDDEPRLANVVEGLCITYGHPEPRLHLVDSPAVNAAILGHTSGDSHFVVTTGLLQTLDRLELEAVVARELSQLRVGVESATVLVAVAALLGPLGLRDGLLERTLDRRQPTVIDLEGVRLTRYPPALASAYEKALGIEPVESGPTVDHLWLLGTSTSRTRGVAQPPLTERIDVLREL